MADCNFLSMTILSPEDLVLSIDDSPDQSNTCPELKAAMDRIFSQSASQLLNGEFFEDSFEVSSLGSTRATTKVVSSPVGVPPFLGFNEESLYPTSSSIAGLSSSSSCRTYEVPLCASAPHDAAVSCAVPIPDINTSSETSLDRTEHSIPQNISTFNEIQTNQELDKTQEEACAYKNIEQEKTAGCDYMSSGECNTGTSSDSEDMSRPFACVSKKQRKRKRKKTRKDMEDICDSNNDDSDDDLEKPSSSCNDKDSLAKTSSQSRKIRLRKDFRVKLKSSTHHSMPGLFLPVVVLKNLKFDRSSTEDSLNSNFREESLDSFNYDSGSSKVSCYRDREMNDDDVSNISFTSLKDNVPEDNSLTLQLPVSGEKLQHRQKLPLVKRKYFDVIKDIKKIVKTFFPCYVVVEKVDSLLLCDNENEIGVTDSILPLPVRVQILSDLCIQGALVCGIKQKKWGLDLAFYSGLLDGVSLEEMSEDEFESLIPRSRNLRKRAKPVCYVEESDHFDDDDVEELWRENTQKKIKDSSSAANECSVKMKQREIETSSDGNGESVSSSGNSLQETEPLKKIRIKMVSKKWAEIRKGHKTAQRLKPASSSKGSVRSLLDKLNLPLDQSEVLNSSRNIPMHSNFPSSVTHGVFTCTAGAVLQQPVLSYSQDFNHFPTFATNPSHQNSGLSTNTGLSQVCLPGLSFDTPSGMIPPSLVRMKSSGTYFPPQPSAVLHPYLSQQWTPFLHNSSETAVGSTAPTISSAPVNTSPVLPAQSLYGIPLVNQLQPMQPQHLILPNMHSFGYPSHLASPTANLMSPPLNRSLPSPLSNQSQRSPAVMPPTSHFQAAPNPYFITMGTGSMGGNVPYSQSQSSYGAMSSYQTSNANSQSLILPHSQALSHPSQLVVQTSQALTAPHVQAILGQFSPRQAPPVLDAPVPRMSLPLKIPPAQSSQQVGTPPHPQANAYWDRSSSSSRVIGKRNYKQAFNKSISPYPRHPGIIQNGQTVSRHNKSSSDPKLHQTSFPPHYNVSQKDQLPTHPQSPGLMLQSNHSHGAYSGQTSLPSTQSANQSVHSSSLPAPNLGSLVSSSPNTSTHPDNSRPRVSCDNNRAKDFSGPTNLLQSCTLPPPPPYRSPSPCIPPNTSTLSEEELRIARRRKLEMKYPIPPGVIIKTEPEDHVPEPSMPHTASATSQQNVVTVPSSLNSVSCALPNTFVSQAAGNTLSCSFVSSPSSQTVATSSCPTRTWHVPSSSVLASSRSPLESVQPINQASTTSVIVTASSLAGPYQAGYTLPASFAPLTTVFSASSANTYSPCSASYPTQASPRAISSNHYGSCYSEPYHMVASTFVTTASSTISHSFNASHANQMPPTAPSLSSAPSQFNWDGGQNRPHHSASSGEANAYPPYPLVHSDFQSASQWSNLKSGNHTSSFVPNPAPFHNNNNLGHPSTSSLPSCNFSYLPKKQTTASCSMSLREPTAPPLLKLPSLSPRIPSSSFSPSVSSTSASSIFPASHLTFTSRINHTSPASPVDKNVMANRRANKEFDTSDKRASKAPEKSVSLETASQRLYDLTKIVQAQEASGLKSDRLDRLKRLLYIKRREFNDLRRQAMVQSLSMELSNGVNNN